MKQLSNKVYCDTLFEHIHIADTIFASPYVDLPYLHIKNFFSKKACEDLIFSINDALQVKQQAEVRQRSKEGILASGLVESYRKTNIVTLSSYFEDTYARELKKHKVAIEDYFSVALSFSTQVQALEYEKGFFYVKHADDSSELVNTQKETVGFKVVAPERKLSSILFVSSHLSQAKENEVHFSGGELVFNYLYDEEGKNIVIFAEAGDLLVFPSHPYFSHEVLPVKEGYRLTLVQWHNTV